MTLDDAKQCTHTQMRALLKSARLSLVGLPPDLSDALELEREKAAAKCQQAKVTVTKVVHVTPSSTVTTITRVEEWTTPRVDVETKTEVTTKETYSTHSN